MEEHEMREKKRAGHVASPTLGGNEFINDELINTELSNFGKTNDSARLTRLLKTCINLGLFFCSQKVSKALKRELSDEEIIACGDASMKAGRPYEALKAYLEAGCKEKLIACGDLCMANEWYYGALEAYSAARNRTKLIECGVAAKYAVVWPNVAELAFQAANRLKQQQAETA